MLSWRSMKFLSIGKFHMAPTKKAPIAVAHGDGIGPEIMDACLAILDASQAQIEIHPVEIGEAVYKKGFSAGIEPKTWETLRQTRAFLKAPITTPQGGGFKSLNVTVRTTLGLYANVRPCASYAPFVATKHPGMDVVIVRENEEDLYTGIEYRQTPDVYHAIKLHSRSGTEKIVRYAFEYAVANDRKKITCFTKDNILKLTDGLFHRVFEEIAKEYPTIAHEHWIIDIGTAKLADTPQDFDVIVLPNLYGDILSDVAAQIAGSVGLGGSANIGLHHAMFEAIHGSAPKRAGQNRANPSGLLQAAVLMLVHLSQPETATLIHNAWLKTLEEGIHTYDIFNPTISKQQVGTKEFAQAVIQRLGKAPETLKSVHYKSAHFESVHITPIAPLQKTLVGVDVFVQASNTQAEALAQKLIPLAEPDFKLTMIGNRGTQVWPHSQPETFCVDEWRCRFMAKSKVTPVQITTLLQRCAQAGIDIVQTQTLAQFDGVPGYTLSSDEQ